MSNLRFEDSSLPIHKYKSKIIEMVHQNQVSVIYGNTGVGKTTQIPKYLHEANMNHDLIIGISQPWRIAATSMAQRVANELGCACGTEVGYAIRAENQCCASTKIKYMTDYHLLSQYHNDPVFSQYGVIIVDEAHERTIWTDLLVGILKQVLQNRTDLKVVITSAPEKNDLFSSFFNGAPVISLESTSCKVALLYQPIKGNDFVSRAVEIVEKSLRSTNDGDYLVFLPTEKHVDECCNLLSSISNISVVKVCESQKSTESLFATLPEVERKVIVTTNLGETLFTITTVRYVVDCGVVMETNHVPGTDSGQCGKEVDISRSRADMRRDRAGCRMKGWCYRIYKKEQYEQFIEDRVPEIKRIDLIELYLKMIDLGFELESFDYLERPDNDRLRKCEERLQNLELLDLSNHLTDIGRNVASISLGIVLGKVICNSRELNPSNDTVTGFLLLAERNLFQSTRGENSYEEFIDEDGDYFTRLNIYNEFTTNGKTKQWCDSKYLCYDALRRIDLLRDEVLEMLDRECGAGKMICAPINKDSIKYSIVKEYYCNICVSTQPDVYVNCRTNVQMYMNPNSSLYKSKPKVILYHECIYHGKRPIMYGLLRLDDNFLRKFPREMEIIKYQFERNQLPVKPKNVKEPSSKKFTKKKAPNLKPKKPEFAHTNYCGDQLVDYEEADDFDNGLDELYGPVNDFDNGLDELYGSVNDFDNGLDELYGPVNDFDNGLDELYGPVNDFDEPFDLYDGHDDYDYEPEIDYGY